MITSQGYSKDPSIMPEGIVVTFGKELMQEQGGVKNFLANFFRTMNEHEAGNYWMHKCSNLPTKDLDIIYISVLNRLWAKVYCGGYKKDQTAIGTTADGREVEINWNYIILSGPVEMCPFKRKLSGFQGFRYCTKLF